MKNAAVVIGSNFGDEGKGLVTDYIVHKIASERNHPILNVRFNGGCQASHTVVTPIQLQRHAFSHFGSGLYNSHCITYLSKDFICNPILFNKELKDISSLLSIMFVNKYCIVTTPWHMIDNQIQETLLGNHKHGSCGLGINSTIQYSPHLYVKELSSSNVVKQYLDSIRDYIINKYNYIPSHFLDIINDYKNINEQYIEDVSIFLKNIIQTDDSIINEFNDVVFEGAQGLLLDKDNTLYYPHLTPSSTGLTNVLKILNNIKSFDKWDINYVSRCYLTRHGAGFLPLEYDGFPPNSNIVDKTNIPNEFQGSIRFGRFNGRLLKYNCLNDFKKQDLNANMNLFITCIDQFIDKIECDFIGKTEYMNKDEFLHRTFELLNINTDGRYYSEGPTRKDIRRFRGDYNDI